jgi:hypothetical protein
MMPCIAFWNGISQNSLFWSVHFTIKTLLQHFALVNYGVLTSRPPHGTASQLMKLRPLRSKKRLPETDELKKAW